jgi:hypothetical protein
MKREYAGAAKDCRRALDLDPGFIKAYFRYSKCCLHTGNVAEALQQLHIAKLTPAISKADRMAIDKEVSTVLVEELK